MRKLYSIIFALFVLLSLTPVGFVAAYTGGSGTPGDPWGIANLTDLTQLKNSPLDWGAYFIQTADIDASDTSTWDGGAGFSPIGNSSTPFSGSYDGQGSVITGLTINRSGTDYVGLFGYVENGVVKNIGVTGVNIKGKNSVGAVAGWCRGGSAAISRCFSSGTVTGNSYVGGLIGYHESSATLQNSGSVASVTGTQIVGGAVGFNPSATITNCYAAGPVTAGSSGGGLTAFGTATNSFWDTQTSL